MKYKAFIFDFDFTLADTSAAIVECFNYSSSAIGLGIMPAEKIISAIGMTLTDMFKYVTGIEDEEILARFTPIYKAKADEIMEEGTHFYPAAVELLKKLKANGVKTGIVSTKNRCRIEGALSRYGYRDLFDNIIGGEDVNHHKPDPEALVKAIELFQCDKSDVLYIGDSTIDAKTAENIGAPFAATLTGATKAEDFAGHPFQLIVSNLGAIEALL